MSKAKINASVPYKPLNKVNTPPDDAVIWRYMNPSKFASMLDANSLWFTRSDRFEDPLEGSFTDAELIHLQANAPFNVECPTTEGRMTTLAFQIISMNMWDRATAFVNCWREGEYESMAMWDLYGHKDGAIAIRSTIGLLKHAFLGFKANIYIGRVNYVNWSNFNLLCPPNELCFRKDLSYAHECEVRAVILGTEPVGDNPPIAEPREESMSQFKDRMPENIQLHFPIPNIITDIVIGPREQARTLPTVQEVMERLKFSKPILLSDRLRPRL